MKGNRLLILWGILCLVLILAALPLITACSQPAPAPPPAPAAEPIKVGVLVPFTGPFADYGPFLKQGMEFRFSQDNNQFAGTPIKLVIEDETADTSAALEKAKKLVTVDKVKVILGPLHSGLAMGIAPYLVENKILNIALMTKPIEMGKGGNYIGPYGTLYSDGMPIGWYAYDQLRYRTMTTMGSDYIAGKRFVGGAVDMFKARGGTVVQEQWVPAGTADFGPYLTAMKQADAVVTWLGGAELTRFLKQYKDFGLKTPVLNVSGDQLRSSQMKELGDPILGTYGEVTYTTRIDNAANKAFIAAFQAKYPGQHIERDVHSAYSAADILMAGLKVTGGDVSFDKLRAAIVGLKMDTAQGPLYIHPSGQAIINRYISQLKIIGGQYLWDVVFTYPSVLDPRL